MANGQQVNPQAYGAMIEALESFASSITTFAAQLESTGNKCAQALGTEDSATVKITTEVTNSKSKYEAIAAEARRIASLMQEELDESMKEETEVWDNDGF